MQSNTPHCDGIILAFTTIYINWGDGGEVNDLKVSGGVWLWGSGPAASQLPEGSPQPGPTSSHGSCLHQGLGCGAWPDLQPHHITAPGRGPLGQTPQPCPVPWLGVAGWDFCRQRWPLPVLSSQSAAGFPC